MATNSVDKGMQAGASLVHSHVFSGLAFSPPEECIRRPNSYDSENLTTAPKS
jgi:hypothetical protein